MFYQTPCKVIAAFCVIACGQAEVGGAAPDANAGNQVVNSVGVKLLLIPAGEFRMGNGHTAEEQTAAFAPYIAGVTPEWFRDDNPPHRVRITRPFFLGAYHVTVGQFRQFAESSHYVTEAEKGENPGAVGFNSRTGTFEFDRTYSWRKVGFEQTDDHPVTNITWNDAVLFCRWLGNKEGIAYRLPTEAEWEYACRAGTATRYYNGDDPEGLAQVGNVADATAKAKFPDWNFGIKARDGYVFTAPVGKFKPNKFGLFDMHGNLGEWCADWYDVDYYRQSPTDDPRGPRCGEFRVVRGGAWGQLPWQAETAVRDRAKQSGYQCSIGFRIARDSNEPHR